LRGFRAFNDFQNYNGYRPDFKGFEAGVRVSSDLQTGFMDFWDFRSDLRDYRPYSRDFTSDFKAFQPDFRYLDQISRITGIPWTAGILGISVISGILGRISGHYSTPDSRSIV